MFRETGRSPEQSSENPAQLQETIDRLRGDRSLSDLIDAQDAAKLSRDFIAIARAATAEQGGRGHAVAASAENRAKYERLVDLGESPEQILASARQNLASAESRIDKLAEDLKDVPAYQELTAAEARLQSLQRETDAAALDARRDTAEPRSEPVRAEDPFRQAGIRPAMEAPKPKRALDDVKPFDIKDLPEDVRKILGKE